ncbi:hypothetical protein QBC34DRAFT_157262 [Podospora aff. communis PSN243]|uniref:Uncharacterized protein n=1 Tax=Podospora aff. communis PSN243 TaxID=3040156 RepID=A0AAV9H160_9PEZI|nr:hypothetical protein QBC34DRAFT_157262 [Podospora aff. communis PSN243]
MSAHRFKEVLVVLANFACGHHATPHGSVSLYGPDASICPDPCECCDGKPRGLRQRHATPARQREGRLPQYTNDDLPSWDLALLDRCYPKSSPPASLGEVQSLCRLARTVTQLSGQLKYSVAAVRSENMHQSLRTIPGSARFVVRRPHLASLSRTAKRDRPARLFLPLTALSCYQALRSASDSGSFSSGSAILPWNQTLACLVA